MSSSISDNSEYPEVCLWAATTEAGFLNFKRNPVYNSILEHVTYEEGIEYIQQFISNTNIISNIEKFKINDKLGNPTKYNFQNFGEFSPTTLRYIKILNDLSQLDLNDKHIVEIGAGYGGQYTVLRQLFKPRKYTFVDLDSVTKLIKRYVTTLELNDTPLDFIDGTRLTESISSDLVISNYAFSECDFKIQDMYIEKILRNTKHCYMLYNNFNGYKHDELIKIINRSNIRVSKEIPQTHPNNVLLTW